MKKLAVLLAAVMAMTLALTGCGSNSNNSSSVASTGSSASGTSSPTPTIDAIKERGKLIMLTEATFAPFEYIENGEVVGADVDIAQEFAKDLGVELEVVDMNFDLLIDSVNAGKGDFAAAGMTVDEERSKQVDFTTKYVKSAQHVIIKKGSGVTADNLDGLVIAVQESTSGDFYATDEINAKEVLRFKSAVEAGTALKSGKCDAVIIDELPAKAIADKSNGELEVLEDKLTDEEYAIACKKGNTDLVEAFNKTLERLMNEGKIDEFVQNHMVVE